MKEILKPIFEIITGEYVILDNVFYNYIIMGFIGIIAFYIAWNLVGKMYRLDIISGKKAVSLIHWIIRLIAFIVIFYIFSLVIWLTKLIYEYKTIVLIIVGSVLLLFIVWKAIKIKKRNENATKRL